MRRRNFIRTVGTGVGLAGAAGCTGLGLGGGDAPDRVTVGYPSPALPVYNFALYPGLNDELDADGVEMGLETFNGYNPMVSALQQGEMDVGVLTLSSIVKAVNQDFPLVAPVGYTREFAFALVANSEIDGWEDLRGKTVAAHSQSSMSTVAGRLMVQEELGGTDAVDFEFIVGTPSRLSALRSGEADAVVVFLSGALQAEADGYGTILGYPWEYDRLSDQTAAALVVTESAMEERTGTVETIVEGALGAYERLYDGDPAEITDAALDTGEFAEFDTEIWVQALEEVRNAGIWPRNGGLDAESIQQGQDVLVSTGLIEEGQRIERDAFVDDRFL